MMFNSVLQLFAFCGYFASFATGQYCSQPPVNHIFSQSQEDFYCPSYRNLMRHVPMEDGLCPTSSIYRKDKNCLSDLDCPEQSYCCFSICNGITRCYNPYLNEWAEELVEPKRKPPCPLIQIAATLQPDSDEAVLQNLENQKMASKATEQPPSTTATSTIATTTTKKAPVATPLVPETPVVSIQTDDKLSGTIESASSSTTTTAPNRTFTNATTTTTTLPVNVITTTVKPPETTPIMTPAPVVTEAVVVHITSTNATTTAAPISITNATVKLPETTPFMAPAPVITEALVIHITSTNATTTAAPISITNATVKPPETTPIMTPAPVVTEAVAVHITSTNTITTAAPISITNATVKLPETIPVMAPAPVVTEAAVVHITSTNATTTAVPVSNTNASVKLPETTPVMTPAPAVTQTVIPQIESTSSNIRVTTSIPREPMEIPIVSTSLTITKAPATTAIPPVALDSQISFVKTEEKLTSIHDTTSSPSISTVFTTIEKKFTNATTPTATKAPSTTQIIDTMITELMSIKNERKSFNRSEPEASSTITTTTTTLSPNITIITPLPQNLTEVAVTTKLPRKSTTAEPIPFTTEAPVHIATTLMPAPAPPPPPKLPVTKYDNYDQIVKTQAGAEDPQFVAEEGV